MRPAVTASVALLLLLVAACSSDDKTSTTGDTHATVHSTASSPTASTSDTAASTTASPDQLHLGGGLSLDACEVVSADLIKADFGADPGQGRNQPASLGDPNAQDCFWFSDETSISVRATTRADRDLPAGAYNYSGQSNAAAVPGADRGWVRILPGPQGSRTVTSIVTVVKGQTGLSMTISIDNHPYDLPTLVRFARDVVAAMP